MTRRPLDYYAAVAPAIVPHLNNRPFTMKRWREGVAGRVVLPEAGAEGDALLDSDAAVPTYPREGETRLVDFPLVNDELALLWMVQFHCIDMNAWYSRVDKPERPDFVVFDLDPPEEEGGFPLPRSRCSARRARGGRSRGLAEDSGAGGMHVLVPIARRATFPQAHEFAERITRLLAGVTPASSPPSG